MRVLSISIAVMATSVLFCMATGCGTLGGLGGQSHLLTYEIRVSSNSPLPPDTKLDLVTSESASGARVYHCTAITNEGSVIYQKATLIFRDKARHLVVAPPASAAHVFAIDHPRVPRSADWTNWQKPIYTDSSSMPWWNVMHDQGQEQRNLEISADGAELRFKVEQWHGMDGM